MIKNGTYGKLTKAYYAKEKAESRAASSDSSTKLTSMAQNSASMSKSVQALMKDSLWQKKTITEKDEKTGTGEGVIYEKGSIEPKATYSINKMSKEERAALVDQLKADAAQRQSQFLDIVHKTISGQAKAFGTAGNDSIWRTLAGGNFTVDAATKAQAQKDIGEDGYWGVIN